MIYFQFDIPKGLGYSKGWHGTMPHCPSNVVVHMYDEVGGYGIAVTPDKSLPKEVTKLDEIEVLTTLTEKMDDDRVYIADRLEDKWVEDIDGR